MAEYVHPTIETDPTEIAEEGTAEIQDRIPGWEARPNDLATIIVYVVAVMIAEGREVSSTVFDAIFRWYGTWAVNLPPNDEVRATVTSTWTALDTAGYTIDAGTTVGVRAAGDELLLFDVSAEVVIPPGSTATLPGAVLLIAQEGGAAASGLGGPGYEAEVIDALAWVDTVVLAGATDGGSDAETDAEYLNRLTTELQLQSPRPILPRDFAILYQRLPGVDRALAIDLYKPADQPNPGDPEDIDRERSITVVGIDSDGEPVDPATKFAGVAMLEAMRETTFEVWAMDPTYTPFVVDFDATAYPDWDTDQVAADGVAAVQDYLHPARFGQPKFTDDRQWLAEDSLRLGELYEVLNRVDGLWRVDTLVFGIQRTVALSAAGDTVTFNAHGYANGTPVQFSSLGGGGGGLAVDTVYYVRDTAANTFKLAAAPGGGAIDITSDAAAAVMAARTSSDIALPGVAPLSRAAIVTGSVSAP